MTLSLNSSQLLDPGPSSQLIIISYNSGRVVAILVVIIMFITLGKYLNYPSSELAQYFQVDAQYHRIL